MFNQTTSTDTKIAVLEERLSSYELMIKKIDEAIQIMGKTSQNISKMLAVHNERLEQCSKTDDLIVSMIEDMKDENKEQYIKVETKIQSVEKRLEDVSRIKWMTIGSAVVLAVLATAFSTLASGWWTPSEMQMLKEDLNRQETSNLNK